MPGGGPMPGGPRGGSCAEAKGGVKKRGGPSEVQVWLRGCRMLCVVYGRVEGVGKWEGLPVHVGGARGRC